MEERANYLLVGSFVLAAIVVSIGFVLWVADVRTTDDPDRYVVVFERAGFVRRLLGVLGFVSGAIETQYDLAHSLAPQSSTS